MPVDSSRDRQLGLYVIKMIFQSILTSQFDNLLVYHIYIYSLRCAAEYRPRTGRLHSSDIVPALDQERNEAPVI
jgi:hypothetical protein